MEVLLIERLLLRTYIYRRFVVVETVDIYRSWLALFFECLGLGLRYQIA